MKAIIINDEIRLYESIPYYWNGTEGYQYATDEQLIADGWMDVVYPEHNPATQYLGEAIVVEGEVEIIEGEEVRHPDHVTFTVINYTEEELAQRLRESAMSEARELRATEIEKYLENQILSEIQVLDDSDAANNQSLYPFWKENLQVKVLEKYQHFGSDNTIWLFKVVQAHTTQVKLEPINTPALWVRVAYDGEILDWVQPTGAHDAYQLGDRVKYNGKIWESTVNANVYAPGIVPGQWVEV